MTNESKTRDCPYCKEEIRVDAVKCKHCGSSVAPERPSHEGTCPYCKEQINPEAIICKHCKSNLIIGIGHTAEQCTCINKSSKTLRLSRSIGLVNLPQFGLAQPGLIGDPISGTGKVVFCYTTCENGIMICHCHTDQGYWYSYECGSC